MKKIIILNIIIFCAFVVNAQNFQGYSDATVTGSGFSYNVQISVTPVGPTNNTLHSGGYKVKLVAVNADSKGYYSRGKTNTYYSCAQLGSFCNPNKFTNVYIGLNYQCKNSGLQRVSFTRINEEQTIVLRLDPNTTCSFELGNVDVKNTMDDAIYRKRINEIEYPQTYGGGSSGASTSNNPAVTNTTSTSSSTTSDTYINNPNVAYNNTTSTKSDLEKGLEKGQQVVDIANGLIDLFTPTPEQVRRKEAEKNRLLVEAEKSKSLNEWRVNKALEEYLIAANKGDITARINIIKELRKTSLDLAYMVPNLNLWYKEGVENKNFDIMNTLGLFISAQDSYLNTHPAYGLSSIFDVIKVLEEAANLGSLDAMLCLANYYDEKKTQYGGGENPDKALYWYKKAAENGSPNAMTIMGLIIRYRNLSSRGVKYKKMDTDEAAFNWFVKSISNPNYKTSIFFKHFDKGSCFSNGSYNQLSIMYEKGIGCEKNKELAKKFKDLYNSPTRIAFKDDFSTNQNKWFEEETDDYSFKIVDGKYSIKSKKGGSWFCTFPIEFPSDKDFTISVDIRKVSNDAYFSGIVIGRNLNNDYNHFVGINGSENYFFSNTGTKPFAKDFILKKNAFNKMVIERREGLIYLYINDKYIGYTIYEDFYGNAFGFTLISGEEGQAIEIDNLEISVSN